MCSYTCKGVFHMQMYFLKPSTLIAFWYSWAPALCRNTFPLYSVTLLFPDSSPASLVILQFCMQTDTILSSRYYGTVWLFSSVASNIINAHSIDYHSPYFSDYKTHLGFRGEWGENPVHLCPRSSEASKLHSDYKMHPHFPPKFGGRGCVL